MQSALTRIGGVESATVDLKASEVLVRFDSNRVKPQQLAKAVTDSGFENTVTNPED